MAKSLKSPVLQLIVIICLYMVFAVLAIFMDAFISSLLSGYSLNELPDVEVSMPNVVAAWKLISINDAVFTFLIPALLFARLVSPQPIQWLHLNNPIRLKPALFVFVIVLAAIPVAGFLYDWNCTWEMAKESVQDNEKSNAISKAMREMPNFASLPIGMLLFAAIPAIARICFFFGALQNVLIRMIAKAPWVGIAITSVLFSVSYFDWNWLVPMIFIGFLFGAIYYLTGNIWLAILGNFITTSADWVGSYLFQRGLTKEDPLHPSATAWYTASICLIVIAGLVWYIRKRIPKPVVVVVNEYQMDIDSIGK